MRTSFVAALPIVLCLLAGQARAAAPNDHDHSHGAAHGHSGDHADAGHGSHGDEEYTIWADLPFWSLIAFVGFVWAIKKLGLWNLLLTSMAAREKAETEAIALAEQQLQAAQAGLRDARGRMEAMDETIRGTLAEAERDAEYTRGQFLAEAEREARASTDRAAWEINRVKNQSLNDIFESLTEKIATATEQRLRQELNPQDQQRLVDQALAELQLR